jgi:hypothetical protein
MKPEMTIMHETGELEMQIMKIIKTENPETLRQVLEHLEKQYEIPRKEAMNEVTRLINEGKIKLRPKITTLKDPINYILSIHGTWYWTTIIIVFFADFASLILPPNGSQFSIYRNVLGLILTLFLIGYCALKAVLPHNELTPVQQFVLSIGVSASLTPLIGFIQYYTSFKDNAFLTTQLIALTTIVLATVGIIREYISQVTIIKDRT